MTLDIIVNNVLLKKGYPIHFYLQALVYAINGLRELHFDSLGVVKSEKFQVNDYKAIKLPKDYVDYVRIGVENGQFVRSLPKREGINRLNNYDGGQKILFSEPSTWAGYGAVNEYGENLGQLYGLGEVTTGFKVIKERGEIQFDQNIGDYVVLDYITNGTSYDNATNVNDYAQAAIEAFIDWQFKAHNRSYSGSEVQQAKYKKRI
jgi:hypothetical protein